MKKLIFLLLIAFSLCVNAQLINRVDTLYSPAGDDTLYHFQGHTSNIIAVMIDFRTIDDTTGARIDIGVGWELFDTTFISFGTSGLPANINASDDYLVAFEKIGIGFAYPKLRFTKGSSSADGTFPVRVTFDP